MVIVVDVLAGMGEVVFAWCMFLAVRGGAGGADFEGVIAVVVFLVVVMGMAERGERSEAHGHQFDEEEHKDCHERYALGPVVVCYRSRETRVCKGVAGGSEEVDECSRYDDAGAKVFRDEECPFWNSYAPMSTRVDWEGGPCGC